MTPENEKQIEELIEAISAVKCGDDKNPIQYMSSFIDLQTKALKSEEAIAAMHEENKRLRETLNACEDHFERQASGLWSGRTMLRKIQQALGKD